MHSFAALLPLSVLVFSSLAMAQEPPLNPPTGLTGTWNVVETQGEGGTVGQAEIENKDGDGNRDVTYTDNEGVEHPIQLRPNPMYPVTGGQYKIYEQDEGQWVQTTGTVTWNAGTSTWIWTEGPGGSSGNLEVADG